MPPSAAARPARVARTAASTYTSAPPRSTCTFRAPFAVRTARRSRSSMPTRPARTAASTCTSAPPRSTRATRVTAAAGTGRGGGHVVRIDPLAERSPSADSFRYLSRAWLFGRGFGPPASTAALRATAVAVRREPCGRLCRLRFDTGRVALPSRCTVRPHYFGPSITVRLRIAGLKGICTNPLAREYH